MSSTILAALVAAAVFLLLCIAYLNYWIEQNRLKQARHQAELGDLVRRCAAALHGIPSHLGSPELEKMVRKLDLQWSEQLLAMEKGNSKLAEHITRLKALAKETSPEPPQAFLPVTSVAQLKELQVCLKKLQGVLDHGKSEGLLQAQDIQEGYRIIKTIFAKAYVESLISTGKAALQKDQLPQAHFAFEQAEKYAAKHADLLEDKAQRAFLREQCQRIVRMLQERNSSSDITSSELAEGLQEIEKEDDWKIKNLYD